jgi:tetratricopeptide (TPR) repeat protein
VALDLEERTTAAARQRVEAATAAHPNDPQYLLLAARVYAAENDSARTESTLRRVLAVDPVNVAAGQALSECLVRQRREAEARELLEQLVERRPTSIEAQTSLALLLERMGDVAGAQTRYEKIIDQDPRAATASHRLAALYADHGGNLDIALNLAVVAKQQLPDDPAVSDTIGWIYAQKELPANALPHLQDAVRASPNDAMYRYHLGSAYLTSGDAEKARAELMRALEIDKNLVAARTALASIRR